MTSCYTKRELTKLRRLRAKLELAVSHSAEAIAIGHQIREIDRLASNRRRATNTLAQLKALEKLSIRLVS